MCYQSAELKMTKYLPSSVDSYIIKGIIIDINCQAQLLIFSSLIPIFNSQRLNSETIQMHPPITHLPPTTSKSWQKLSNIKIIKKHFLNNSNSNSTTIVCPNNFQNDILNSFKNNFYRMSS